jgi:hypothetical protein
MQPRAGTELYSLDQSLRSCSCWQSGSGGDHVKPAGHPLGYPLAHGVENVENHDRNSVVCLLTEFNPNTKRCELKWN